MPKNLKQVKNENLSVSSVLRIHPRFMRSVHLERDLADPDSSKSYVLTPVAQQTLERISTSFKKNSTQRAWRIAGDYGSGKTDFALTLARVAKGEKHELPDSIRRYIGRNAFQPAVATGDAEPLGITVLRALGVKRESKQRPTTDEVINAVKSTVIKVQKKGYSGVMLVLDELGKNLEYAARNPSQDDIFLLQRLAEESSRSGERAFVIVVMLHQGVASYATGLDTALKREWDKVAGRFEEIIFVQPLEQVVTLLSATLNVDTDNIPANVIQDARAGMKAALRSGLYGQAPADSLVELSARIFPLHPTSVPVLTRSMRKFGQNERSLFSFISSGEPFGLQSFIDKPIATADYYRVENVFDFVRTNLLSSLVNGGQHTNWSMIDSVLASTVVETTEEQAVLKTVAMLNLLDSPDLPSTEEVVALAVGGQKGAVIGAINKLKKQGVIYERGLIKGLCLWPHTSVNLDEKLSYALEITQRNNGIHELCRHIDADPLVPRAYYTHTGTLRFASVAVLPASDLEKKLESLPDLAKSEADLMLNMVLPVDEAEQRKARKLLSDKSAELPDGAYFAVGPVQRQSIASLRDLVAWEWIRSHVPELAGDRHAREEVGRQIKLAQKQLHVSLEGIDSLAVSNGGRIAWYCSSYTEPVTLANGKELLTFLGEECKRIYHMSPTVFNELINRKSPSAAAVSARTKLAEVMATSPHLPYLGLDSSKRPPEMALYLSILLAGGFHREGAHGWVFQLPKPREDRCNLLPTIGMITKILKAGGQDALVPLPEVLREMTKPPYGVRGGLQPFVIAIYIATHHQRVALYEDGTYLHEVGGEAFLRMMKEPQHFQLQYCELDTVRAEVLSGLLSCLEIDPRDVSRLDLIDLVRPLAIFISREIPEYARKTSSLSVKAIAVRKALIEAREPIKLIFTTLPQACGLPPISKANSVNQNEFAATLKSALHEIRSAYSALIDRLNSAIVAAFRLDQSAKNARELIMGRAQQLAVAVSEPTLKAFSLRLSDAKLGQREWIESIANLLARKSAERWTNKDEEEFNHQLEIQSAKFLRTEMALIGTTKKLNGHACRIALTKSDGTEVGDLIDWGGMDDRRIKVAEDKIRSILSEHGRYGIAAAMRAIWQQLEKDDQRMEKHE